MSQTLSSFHRNFVQIGLTTYKLKWIRENPGAFDRGLARRGLPLQAEKVHSDACEPADPGHVGEGFGRLLGCRKRERAVA
jgi:hypothetical protein